MQHIYIFNMSYVKHIADDQIIRSMQYIHISIGIKYVAHDNMQVKLWSETSFGTFQQ